MGFALRPDVWGVGYGLETVQLLLGLGFEDLDLHRTWGARSPLNEASAKTMLRAGMVEEERIREHVQKNGGHLHGAERGSLGAERHPQIGDFGHSVHRHS
ncbi:GNAT family N-acetyltransferase [Streptomyces sp. NPDC002537]